MTADETLARLLRGQGRFIDDESRPGMLHMAVLRAPVAHGAITALAAEDALAVPGVRLVLTAADLAREGVGPIGLRGPLTDALDGVFREPRRPVLAEGKVVYVGQPVAAVIAETVAAALDGCEAIALEIDEAPVVIDPLTAQDCPPIWTEIPANTAFRWQKGDVAEMDARIAGAALVVAETVHHPRIVVAPVEPRGALAEELGGRLTLTVPSQGVRGLQTALSRTLGIAPEDLRVLTHDVGGSFAVKIWPYPEHVLALVAARRTGCPVKWVATRSESFLCDAPGRGRVDRATLALDEAGQFLAFRIDAVADMGAFLSPAAPSIVTTGAVRPFGQVYRILAQSYEVTAVLTNAPPTDAYRGAGKPESTTTLERLIDMAAHRLGVPGEELRRRNLLTPEDLPQDTPMGETIDAGNFPRIAAGVKEAADWDGVPARKAESARRSLLRGVALGFQMHATGGAVTETSEVRALADGTVLVRSGAQDSGQGHREALGRIVAETLDLPRERIRVEQGDSDWDGVAGASGGSNLLPVTAPTVHRAAKAMLARARSAAAGMLEAAEADLDWGDGAFRIVGTDSLVALEAVAARMEDDDDNCMARLTFEGTHTTWPNGASICEVEVDPATGAARVDRFTSVNDLGRIVHASGALGQVQGGIAQGIGEALSEGMVFDPEGQPLTGTMMDYGLPRADEVPALALSWMETPSPNAELGAKGVGELSSIGTPGVVINAVMDALADAGVDHLDRPLTPARIWQALRDKGACGPF